MKTPSIGTVISIDFPVISKIPEGKSLARTNVLLEKKYRPYHPLRIYLMGMTHGKYLCLILLGCAS